MRNLIKILIMAFLSVAVTIVILPFITQPRTDPVSANPNHCPDGHTCWCGQQKSSGKIQLMVDQAIANGWIEVDMSLCIPPEPLPTYTPFQPVITWTPIPRPTDTRWPTLTYTKPPDPSKTPSEPSKTAHPTKTDKPVIQTVPVLPAATGGICDTCYEERRQADALETLAARP